MKKIYICKRTDGGMNERGFLFHVDVGNALHHTEKGVQQLLVVLGS